MDVVYTTPLEIWDRTGRAKSRKVEEEGVEPGQIINLKAHVIEDSVTVYADNEETEDYDVNFKNNTITYAGGETADLTIHYKTAPVPNHTTVDKIEQATDTVEEETEVKFGKLRRVKEEVYESDGSRRQTMMLNRVPVRDVEKVEYNASNKRSSVPNWTELEENEYYKKSNIGLKFRKPERSPPNNHEAARVTYVYGYDHVPGQIKDLTEMLAITSLYKDAVKGAGIDGRDNFSPETTEQFQAEIQRALEEWSREYYANFTGVTRYGDEEIVDEEG